MKRFVRIGLILGAAMLLGFTGCNKKVSSSILSFTGTPYTALEAGTDGSLGSSGKYVLFGDWPQTIKVDDVDIDETKSVEVGIFTYYKGNDDAWYAKLSGKYYKVEPIKWCVLTDDYRGNNLLLAENILTNCAYYDYGFVDRKDGDADVYPNNYGESRIRAYLNGLSYNVKESDDAEQEENKEFLGKGFLQTAFSEAAWKTIAETVVDNSGDSTTDAAGNFPKADGTDPDYPDYTCANTTDKIFLLSEREVTAAEYGFTEYDVYETGKSRIRMTTDFAKTSGAFQSSAKGCGGDWWLRSPGYRNSFCARDVECDSYAGYYGSVDDTRLGVCPALCLKN